MSLSCLRFCLFWLVCLSVKATFSSHLLLPALHFTLSHTRTLDTLLHYTTTFTLRSPRYNTHHALQIPSPRRHLPASQPASCQPSVSPLKYQLLTGQSAGRAPVSCNSNSTLAVTPACPCALQYHNRNTPAAIRAQISLSPSRLASSSPPPPHTPPRPS